jgi:hypothetical protein
VSAVDLVGFHAAIDQPKSMLDVRKTTRKKVKRPKKWIQRTSLRTIWPGMYPRLYDGRVVRANDKGEKKNGNPSLHGETDVDQEVATATGDERHRCRREEDGDLAS